MTLLKTSFALLFILAIACNSTKNSTDSTTEASSTAVETSTASAMMTDGFEKAEIMTSNEEGCPYVLKMVNMEDELFDPINLETSFQSNGEKVWVKYRRLRMANRCNGASPVSIESIQQRSK